MKVFIHFEDCLEVSNVKATEGKEEGRRRRG